ncbi:MAG TPA: response regulator [Nitrospiria bacterium]|nr:response regulator [Nitrospiria bacterium]
MSKKILLVDSNLAVQKMVEITLAKEGYVVACADNSLSALDMALKARPDLILADSQLQGMRFEAFCQKLRHKERLNNIPLLLLINASEIIDERRLKSAGIADFVQKPIDPADLVRKVKRQMEERETDVIDTVVMNTKTLASLENSIPPPTPVEKEDMNKMEEMLGWSRPGESKAEKPSPLHSAPVSSTAPSAPSEPAPRPAAAGPVEFEKISFLEETRILSSHPSASPSPAPSAPPPAAPPPGPSKIDAFESLGPDILTTRETDQHRPTSSAKRSVSPSPEGIAGQAEQLTRELVEKAVRETVEQILWEVVPAVAEDEVKKAIEKLKKEV